MLFIFRAIKTFHFKVRHSIELYMFKWMLYCCKVFTVSATYSTEMYYLAYTHYFVSESR
jgi:hypothetical protein